MNQTKLLFIDSKVENYHHLISEVDLKTRIVVLEPNQNGIDKISKSLGECSDVETIHIISHGAKGALCVGNSLLKNDNIHLYAENIQQWGKSLSADGEILIYGCQVASGKEGKEFVRQLHQLTGANIAASETLTGNVSRGGNWNLEVIFGQLKSALAFTPEVRATYAGVLANIVVDTTNDVVDNSDGVTSLREAIIEANSTPEDDTIQLTAGATYNLTIAGSEEDAAATGDLDIVVGGGEITVISEGGEQAVIDAGGETGIGDRVFDVLEDAALQLENVAITGGSGITNNSGTLTINNSTISGSDGSGIFSIFGTVSINNSTISGNYSTGVGGAGGITNNSGTLTINNSTISGNSASSGGGLSSLGVSATVSINNSIISGNSVSGGATGASRGAGIWLGSGTLTINNSTISDNSASSSGGGIFLFGGTASINNSTISGNSASGGGGISLDRGILTINHSTISSNSASRGGGIDNVFGTASISNSTITNNEADAGRGSGIFHNNLTDTNPNSTNVTSSIVSGNVNTDIEIDAVISTEIDVVSNDSFTSDGNNLIGAGNVINVFNGDNDQVGITDPLLGDLADNGGPTLTHLPLPNSPAIDAGSNPNAQTTDQRGEPRLAGAGVDIGAVELQIIQEITGTAEADILNGTIEQDTIFGLDGNDVINGLDDDDVLFGNRDLDTLNGDAGNDTIYGGRDGDLVFGNIGEDFLRGDRGSDSIFGQEDNDTIFGGRDNDFVDGGFGDDSISGDLGSDTLSGGQGIDTLSGGGDADIFQLAVGEGLDIITDFTDGIDLIQLPDFLSFSDLGISQTDDNSTLITVTDNGEELALLNNISASLITETDFV